MQWDRIFPRILLYSLKDIFDTNSFQKWKLKVFEQHIYLGFVFNVLNSTYNLLGENKICFQNL